MTSEPSAFVVALAQFDAMKAPTVIVPVVSDGEEGVFYASYQGDAEWMALASAKEHQADLAIACCKHAYADAHAAGAQARQPKGDR